MTTPARAGDAATAVAGVAAAIPVRSDPFAQRTLYRSAVAQLQRGRIGEFKRLAGQLQGYALAPYLDYHLLRSRFAYATPEEVKSFLDEHSELAVTPILHRRWLKRLGRNRDWTTLYAERIETSDAELNCYQLRAAYNTGRRDEALAGTTAAWVKPSSQPKACDPLFEVWRNSPHFTGTVAWQRFAAALQDNEVTLARYLLRNFDGSSLRAAEALYQAHVQPERLRRKQRYLDIAATTGSAGEQYRALLTHCLTRWLRRDPEAALRTVPDYLAEATLTPGQRLQVAEALAVAGAHEGLFPEPAAREQIVTLTTIEALADQGIEQQLWREVTYWIERLPAEERQKPRWQYWLARALEASMGASERARLGFRALADRRHYYGFLAARQLGVAGKLNAAPRQQSPDLLTRVRTNPGLRRSLELHAVGDDLNGRREWSRAVRALAPDDQRLAAELALEQGLVTQAIFTANGADALNHLHLRFPIAFEPQFRQAGFKTNLPLPTLLSIARQESALNHRARSSADARGLMQMLPSTARLVARRARERSPTPEQLYDPGTNITLGSFHLAWLVSRYNGQTPLAIAAYNAGEHRVDRWMKDRAGVQMDVWNETIPFRETRNYVKNTLAFRHVYALQLGSPLPFLSRVEATVRPRNVD